MSPTIPSFDDFKKRITLNPDTAGKQQPVDAPPTFDEFKQSRDAGSGTAAHKSLKSEGFLESAWKSITSPVRGAYEMLTPHSRAEKQAQIQKALNWADRFVAAHNGGTDEEKKAVNDEGMVALPGGSTVYKAQEGNYLGAAGDLAGVVTLGGIAKGAASETAARVANATKAGAWTAAKATPMLGKGIRAGIEEFKKSSPDYVDPKVTAQAERTAKIKTDAKTRVDAYAEAKAAKKAEADAAAAPSQYGNTGTPTGVVDPAQSAVTPPLPPPSQPTGGATIGGTTTTTSGTVQPQLMYGEQPKPVTPQPFRPNPAIRARMQTATGGSDAGMPTGSRLPSPRTPAFGPDVSLSPKTAPPAPAPTPVAPAPFRPNPNILRKGKFGGPSTGSPGMPSSRPVSVKPRQGPSLYKGKAEAAAAETEGGSPAPPPGAPPAANGGPSAPEGSTVIPPKPGVTYSAHDIAKMEQINASRTAIDGQMSAFLKEKGVSKADWGKSTPEQKTKWATDAGVNNSIRGVGGKRSKYTDPARIQDMADLLDDAPSGPTLYQGNK